MPKVRVNGLALHYRELGPDHPTTVLYVSSVLWGGEAFDDMLTELAKDFHLVIPDLHGHGKSDYREFMTLEGMTEDFHVLMKTLRLQHVVWFGCSIGGMIGMRLALAYPDLLDALVLMSTTARPDPPEIREPTLQLWQMFRAGHREDIVDSAMKFFFAARTYQDRPDLIAKYRTALIEMKQVDGMYAAVLAAFNRSDMGDAIRRISLPTLVMTGREDSAATPAQAAFIAAHIPNAQVEIINEANHLVGIEKPFEISRLVRAFLARTLPGLKPMVA